MLLTVNRHDGLQVSCDSVRIIYRSRFMDYVNLVTATTCTCVCECCMVHCVHLCVCV